MDKLDFIDGEEPAEPTVAAVTPEAAPSEAPPAAAVAPEPQGEAPSTGQPRGPDGKFAPKAQDAAPAAPDAQPPADPPAAPSQATAQPPEGFVPVGVVQAMREELNAFKRQQNQTPPAAPQPAPDVYADPEGFAQYSQVQVINERLHWSYKVAEAAHGAEVVQQAQQWAEQRYAQDPVFAQRAQAQPDPYGWAIDEWKRDQVLSKLSDPQLIDKFLAFASGQQAASAALAAPPAPPPSPAAPPPSIASAPSAGGAQHVPTGPGQAYGAVIPS